METPKTGLAANIRSWMKSRERNFTPLQLCESLDIPKGIERSRVWNAICDFEKRGEINRARKGTFCYNYSFHKTVKSPLKTKILKAIYVSTSGFIASDIQRLAEVSDRRYVQRIIRQLAEKGHIQIVGRRQSLFNLGIERIYIVVNRDRFRLEVLE